ncbi:hypothetical protein LCGC14_0547360 [marine sediment metagenome]|uniref:Uncharacterized protein n=1 Tax=marine sediment metagenome TaxID=412755 RepID=A0A0F9RVS4_9ZZZZ
MSEVKPKDGDWIEYHDFGGIRGGSYPWVVKVLGEELQQPRSHRTKNKVAYDEAQFFAGPDIYAVGSDGETNGPSGLNFL